MADLFNPYGLNTLENTKVGTGPAGSLLPTEPGAGMSIASGGIYTNNNGVDWISKLIPEGSPGAGMSYLDRVGPIPGTNTQQQAQLPWQSDMSAVTPMASAGPAVSPLDSTIPMAQLGQSRRADTFGATESVGRLATGNQDIIRQWGWSTDENGQWFNENGDTGVWLPNGQFLNTTQSKVFDPQTGQVTPYAAPGLGQQSRGPGGWPAESTPGMNPVISTADNGMGWASTISPTFTNMLMQMLADRMNQGTDPYSASAFLPSTGGMSSEGQLAAGMPQLLHDLDNFMRGNGPSQGFQATLSDAATSGLHATLPMSLVKAQEGTLGAPTPEVLNEAMRTGLPVDQIDAWQHAIQAQQRNIDQNATNLREQFAFRGNLASSPFGQAMTDFYGQTAKDQNALLADMVRQSSESAAGRRVDAGKAVLDANLGTAGLGLEAGRMQLSNEQLAAQNKLASSQFMTSMQAQIGQLFAGMDQSSINATLQEFIRTNPDYSPLLNMMFGMATTFPPLVNEGASAKSTVGTIAGLAPGVIDLIAQYGPSILDLIKGNGGSLDASSWPFGSNTTTPPFFGDIRSPFEWPFYDYGY